MGHLEDGGVWGRWLLSYDRFEEDTGRRRNRTLGLVGVMDDLGAGLRPVEIKQYAPVTM